MGIGGVNPERALLNALLVLVYESNCSRRPWILDRGDFVPAHREVLVPGIGFHVHVTTQGHAAIAGYPALVPHSGFVCRATIDPPGPVVAEQHALFDAAGTRVDPGIARDPGIGCIRETVASRGDNRRVWRHELVVVVGVECPAKLQLLEVAPAESSLTFQFGASQDRQEEAGQNRDDRNHDQQFNQCKSVARSKNPRPRNYARPKDHGPAISPITAARSVRVHRVPLSFSERKVPSGSYKRDCGGEGCGDSERYVSGQYLLCRVEPWHDVTSKLSLAS